MTEPNDALDRLRRANLLPPGAPADGDELAAVAAECERRVDAQRGVTPSGPATEESLHPAPGPQARWRPAVVFSLAFAAMVAVVAVVALVNDSGGFVLESDVANTAPPTTSGMIGSVAYVDELVYYEDEGRTMQTSVFFPADGDDPMPVVVLYGVFRVGQQERELARKIAERGAVVFAPLWVDADSSTLTANEYLSGSMWNRAACAVGYAQRHADSYGGDPTRTTVMGSGGGEHPATWVALGLADTGDCADPVPFPATGLVAGQSQWLFQEEQFDDAFGVEGAAGEVTVDRFFDPARWDRAETLSVFLWTTTWSGNSNGIEDPPTEDSWIWSRDPDGAIVADLAALDAFDDGLITFSDNARLMNLRMSQSGIDVRYSVSDSAAYGLDDAGLESAWHVIAGE